MAQGWHRRGLAMIALIAIVAAIALLLIPHGHNGDAGPWFAILPIVLFVGVIAPRSQWLPISSSDQCRAIDDPLLPASFQRPPPLRRS